MSALNPPSCNLWTPNPSIEPLLQYFPPNPKLTLYDSIRSIIMLFQYLAVIAASAMVVIAGPVPAADAVVDRSEAVPEAVRAAYIYTDVDE